VPRDFGRFDGLGSSMVEYVNSSTKNIIFFLL
jgi:hypothetical protein